MPLDIATYRRNQLRGLLNLGPRAIQVAACSMETIQSFLIKNGHDMRFIMRAAHHSADAAKSPVSPDFKNLLTRRIRDGQARAGSLTGKIVLYGATPTAQAFLGLFDDGCAYECALDDNREYEGYALYGQHQTLPILAPAAVDMDDVSAVIIASYLHDAVIAQKLRQENFKGRILSTPPETPAQLMTGLEGFYA